MASINAKNDHEQLMDMVLRVLVVADLLVSKPRAKSLDEPDDTEEQPQNAGVWAELQKTHFQTLDV